MQYNRFWIAKLLRGFNFALPPENGVSTKPSRPLISSRFSLPTVSCRSVSGVGNVPVPRGVVIVHMSSCYLYSGDKPLRRLRPTSDYLTPYQQRASSRGQDASREPLEQHVSAALSGGQCCYLIGCSQARKLVMVATANILLQLVPTKDCRC